MLFILLILLSVFSVVMPQEFVADPTNHSRIARNSMATCETYFVDALLANDVTNANNVPPTGYTRLTCSGWAGCAASQGKSQQDLNRGKSGRSIYLFVKTQTFCPGDSGSYITDIEVLLGDKQCSSGFTSPSGLGRYDLNAEAGGDNLYLCVKKESLGSRFVLSDWQVYSTTPSPAFSFVSYDLNRGINGADSIFWGWNRATCSASCFNGGICSKTGVCRCRDGFAGERCNVCATGYYKYPSCISCDATTNCTGHGTCATDGSCACSTGFTGTNCASCAANYYDYPNCVQCTAASKCSSHGTCSSKGDCTCNTGFQGTNCGQCAPGYYGYPSCVACDAVTKCSSKGSCATDGSCACDPGFGGEHCEKCAPGYYGYPDCVACDAATTCHANGQCKEDGSCQCSAGYDGDFCDKCAPGFYGFPYCSSCDETTSCSDHGSCARDGSCECREGYKGDSCSQCSDDHYDYPNCVYCLASDTCSSKGTCNDDGECECATGFDGTNCGECAPGYYGYPNCKYCDAKTTCSGHGSCDIDGNCACEGGRAEPDCSTCSPSYYGDECVFCDAASTCHNHGSCSDTDGSCQCREEFGGLTCGECATDYYNYPTCVYCHADATCSSHGHCTTQGTCECDEGFQGALCNICKPGHYGPNCVACDAANKCSNNGKCSDSDGSCECEVGFTGDNCGACAVGHYNYPSCVSCDATITCSNNGQCKADGSCECAAGYTGEHCGQCASGYFGYPHCVACDAATTCSGNGLCATDGSCDCSAGYSGAHCDQCDSTRLVYPICYPRLSSPANYIFNKGAFNSGKLTIIDTNGAVQTAALKDVAVTTPQTSGYQFSGATIAGVAGAAGLCLDIYGAVVKAGAAVGAFKCNAQSNQKWTYSGTSGDWAEIHPDGQPTFCVAPAGGKTVAGTALVIQKCDGSYEQQWSRSSTVPPAVPVNVHTGTAVNQADVNTVTGYKNAFASIFGVDSQTIKIDVVNVTEADQASYGGKYLLDITFTVNVPIVSATVISQVEQHAQQAVKRIQPQASTKFTNVNRVAPIIAAGYNYIFNKAAYESQSYRVFTTTNSFESTLKAPADDPSGVFMFSGTAIKIKSGQCLDISKSEMKAGTVVGVYKCNNQANQKWVYGSTTEWATIHPSSDKTLCLAPEAGQTSVRLQKCNGASYQLWKRSADAPPVVFAI